MKWSLARLGNWSYFGVPLLLAVLASYSITAVQHNSDDSRRTQLTLGYLCRLAYQLHSLEDEIILEKGLSAKQVKAETGLYQRIEKTLHGFKPSRSHTGVIRRVSEEFHAYDAALQQEFPYIGRGDIVQAEKIAHEKVDPQFGALIQAILQANRYYGQKAAQESLQAGMGTTAILLGGAAVMGLFLSGIAHLQRGAVRQEAVQRQEAHIRALISNISDIILVVDAAGTILFVNETVKRLLGVPSQDVNGRRFLEFVHTEDQSAASELLRAAAQSSAGLTDELRLCDQAGEPHHFEVVTNNLLAHVEIAGLLVTLRDVTERKVFEDRITHQAMHDALTNLPNRAYFVDRLKRALTQAERLQHPTAVIFIDLDNFKLINDSLGHEAGDQLLISIAERLRGCVRPEDTTARLGGDEFTILLEKLADVEDAVGVAERIVASLRAPIKLASSEVFASASIGIAVSDPGACDPDALLRNADTAMYEAKSGGKAGYTLFETSMNDRVGERIAMETGLRFALERNELCIHYQPLIDLETGCLSGVEALLRWEHPEQGLIAPGKFIPIAEETGMIVPIGYWVLEEACRQAQEWKIAYSASKPFTMNVNLSGKQLQREDVVERVASVLQQTGLSPGNLKLEITESVMMDDTESTISKLTQLKALGVKLALDDFGTGYSTMARLSAFPLDTIKIDRSFVNRLSEHEEAASIVGAIIQLSKALKMDVTGEGIETEDQVSQLQWLGCTTGQGFYFAKPLTADTIDHEMASGTKMYDKKHDEVEKELIERLLRAA